MKRKLVSIITPMYNGAKLVGQTIESVLAQTHIEWEMLVVDDCSQDDGRGQVVVQKYMETDSRIKLIVLPENRGASGARNKGIRSAEGEFLAFLDADDLWDADFLEKQLLFLQEKNAEIVFSSYRRIGEDTNDTVLDPFIVPVMVRYKDILKTLPICPSTAILDIGRLGKHYFDERMGSLRDDYVFWLYLLKNHVDIAHGNQEILASYRIRKDAVTANKFSVIKPQWKVLREIEKISFFKCVYYISCWAIISLRKYRKI